MSTNTENNFELRALVSLSSMVVGLFAHQSPQSTSLFLCKYATPFASYSEAICLVETNFTLEKKTHACQQIMIFLIDI